MGYVTQARDTDREVEEILFAAYRVMPPWEKIRRVSELSRACSMLALAGLRERHPHASEAELRRRLAEMHLGSELLAEVEAAVQSSSAGVR